MFEFWIDQRSSASADSTLLLCRRIPAGLVRASGFLAHDATAVWWLAL